MKMLSQRITIFILFLALLITIPACREDIISPDNPIAAENVPVRTKSINYYELLINAKNVSYAVIDNTYFSYESTNIYYSINKYQSGSVFLKLKDSNNKIIYSFVINQSNAGNANLVQGIAPSSVEVDFVNFTGQFTLQLSGYL
jgi:hypothetical protein